jgi:tetratricopeptide (TPR) repeat protein
MEVTMPRPLILALPLALLIAAPSAVFAGDREARRFYDKAVERWQDPDPNLPIRYAEKALEHAQNKILRANVLFLLGRLHHSRTGNFEKARGYYDTLVKENIGVRDNTLKKVKSDAFRNLGNLIYAETGDLTKSLAKYRASHKTYASAETADVLSQFLFRIGRDASKAASARKKQIEASLKLAEEAIERDAKQRERDVSETARFKLQLVITLKANGKEEEAAKAKEAVRFDQLGEQSLYQQGVLMALEGGDPAKIAEVLERSLAPRPTPKTRNDMRHFIRTEPDFKPFLNRPEWKALIKNEPLEGGEKPASRPAK